MRGRPRKIDSQKINAARELRANELADMIIEQHLTIRQVAEKTGMSKSTVHKYLKKYIDSPSEQKEIFNLCMENLNYEDFDANYMFTTGIGRCGE